MKTIQQKLNTVLFLLLIGCAATSCGNDKKEKNDPEQSSDEIENASTNNTDATSPQSQQVDRSRIGPDDVGTASPDFSEADAAAILLDCNYFKENSNAILKDNPNAPVDYIINCVTTIDGKLTIEPGVVIAFEQGAGMDFKSTSSFKLNGTVEKPIVLTAKEKIKGFWQGVWTESTSMVNMMSYVTIDYAGGRSNAALSIQNGASILNLEHCTFSNSKEYGMLTKKAVGKDVQNIVMNSCTFTNNKIPFKSDVSRLRLFNGSNKFSANEKDYIQLDGGAIRGDATWAKLDVPYFLQGDLKIEDGLFTVEAGTDIIMSAQKWIHVYSDASLVMVGTEDDPISIRGEHDIAGFWQQIGFRSSSPLNEIAYVHIKNAGMTTKKPNGAVWLERGQFLNIHDVTFIKCFEFGISVNDLERSHLKYANLSLDNTPKLFSDWKGNEISAPESR